MSVLNRVSGRTLVVAMTVLLLVGTYFFFLRDTTEKRTLTAHFPRAVSIFVGSDVRILLDALPDRAIPARVSFVADVAQFTPKTVETQSEREKLMFRVKARIAPALLQRHLQLVKTGLPGTAYLRLDPNVPWPEKVSRLVED